MWLHTDCFHPICTLLCIVRVEENSQGMCMQGMQPVGTMGKKNIYIILYRIYH